MTFLQVGCSLMVWSHSHIMMATGPIQGQHDASTQPRRLRQRRCCLDGMNLKQLLLEFDCVQSLRRYMFPFSPRVLRPAQPHIAHTTCHYFPPPSRSASTHPWRSGHLQSSGFILSWPSPTLADVLAWKKKRSTIRKRIWSRL